MPMSRSLSDYCNIKHVSTLYLSMYLLMSVSNVYNVDLKIVGSNRHTSMSIYYDIKHASALYLYMLMSMSISMSMSMSIGYVYIYVYVYFCALYDKTCIYVNFIKIYIF